MREAGIEGVKKGGEENSKPTGEKIKQEIRGWKVVRSKERKKGR